MTDEQYNVVVGRRQTYDQLLWQTPVLSLTAQAFLLTIVLGHDTGFWAREMSALLSLMTALASIQLMAKHRYYERLACDMLQQYEEGKRKGCKDFEVVHAHRPLRDEKVCFLVRWSSYAVWMIALSTFAVVALIVLVKTDLIS